MTASSIKAPLNWSPNREPPGFSFSIHPILYICLETAQVGQVGGVVGRFPAGGENLRRLPAPVFNVPVGEGQVGALVMTVGGQVQPVTRINAVGRKNPEGRIPDVQLMRVNQNKQARRRGRGDLRQFAKGPGGVVAVEADAAQLKGRFRAFFQPLIQRSSSMMRGGWPVRRMPMRKILPAIHNASAAVARSKADVPIESTNGGLALTRLSMMNGV